jgi:uncharacterized membrane protein YkoI
MMFFPKAVLLSLFVASSVTALAGGRDGNRHRPEQDAAYSATRSGDIRPFGEIRQRVTPRMGGASYLGSEFDPSSATYRLKFMRGASVIWVDVDARTGAIIGRSGD